MTTEPISEEEAEAMTRMIAALNGIPVSQRDDGIIIVGAQGIDTYNNECVEDTSFKGRFNYPKGAIVPTHKNHVKTSQWETALKVVKSYRRE